MRLFTAVLTATALAGAAALAQVGQVSGWPPTQIVSAPAGYTGPGDLTTYTWFVSTARAYSAATRGTKAVQLCQPAGSNCVDVSSDGTTGLVPNAPTVNGAACDNSGHICTIQCAYNQLGVAADDKCRLTSSQQPLWKVSAIGSFPCGQYVRANPSLLQSTSSTLVTQPFLASAVAKRNSGQSANQNAIIGSKVASPVLLYHDVGASIVDIYSNPTGPVQVALTDNTFGSITAIYNGASSYINANGTTATGSVAANDPSAVVLVGIDEGAGMGYDGIICEAGWAGGISSTTTAASVEANAKTFYGF